MGSPRRKIGNVHPGASFVDMNYEDFAASAAVMAAAFRGIHRSPGEIILDAVNRTRRVVGKNTNLGIALLLVVLAKGTSRESIAATLKNLTIRDASLTYEAIRLAKPGGLGTAAEQDVRGEPSVPLLDAMKIAAPRDLIARQYANHFSDVLDMVAALMEGHDQFGCIEAAIIHCQLTLMALFPDSLIARKNGLAIGEDIQHRAKNVLTLGGLSTTEGRAAGRALDAHLRSDGNKLNPGTTADLVAASLFVALREGKLELNSPFPLNVEDWL